MSRLSIYQDDAGGTPATYTDHAKIAAQLKQIGVEFERWEAAQPLTADATQDEVLAAYRKQVDRLMTAHGFKSVDVVSLRPDNPNCETMRAKFLSEHTHGDFEVRFFVDGSGLFYLHAMGKVYCVLCEKGDLISVPAKTTHWFDMGTQPNFKCIRLFTTPEGWVAEFTGNDIAKRFPTYDAFVGAGA